MFQAQKLKFLLGVFGPVLGLTALSGCALILALPTLATLLLSNYPPQFAFTSQYSAPLIPLVLGTSILGLARLKPRMQGPISAAVLVSSLAFSLLAGDLPFSRHFAPSVFQTEPRYAAFEKNLALVPAGARVAAENNLTPHLSHRRYIHDIEYEGVQDAQYLALDYASLGRSQAEFQPQIEHLQAQGYLEIATGDGLALLHRLIKSLSPRTSPSGGDFGVGGVVQIHQINIFADQHTGSIEVRSRWSWRPAESTVVGSARGGRILEEAAR